MAPPPPSFRWKKKCAPPPPRAEKRRRRGAVILSSSPPLATQIMGLGAMANPMFALKGRGMIQGVHPPNFPLKHATKDMRLAMGLAEKARRPSSSPRTVARRPPSASRSIAKGRSSLEKWCMLTSTALPFFLHSSALTCRRRSPCQGPRLASSTRPWILATQTTTSRQCASESPEAKHPHWHCEATTVSEGQARGDRVGVYPPLSSFFCSLFSLRVYICSL